MRIVLSAAAAAALTCSLAGSAAAAGPQPAEAHHAAKRCPPKKASRHTARRCPATKRAPKAGPVTTVTVTLLPGSVAIVEIPALPLPGGQVVIGTGVTYGVPLTGTLTGVVAGKVELLKDIPVTLKSAAIKPGVVDVLGDPSCGGAATLRINPASIVTLDGSRPSRAVLKPSGVASATANVMLRLAFDSRTEPGCDKPLVGMGYSETPFSAKVEGKVGAKGLLALPLASAPTPVTVAVCLTPGAADKPCATGPVGYPVKITVRVEVAISLKSGA